MACATEPETASVCCCFSLFSCQGAWSVTNPAVTHPCIAAPFARHPLRLSQTVWYCQEGNSRDNPEGSDHSLEVFVSLGSGRFLMLKRLVEDIRHSYMTTGSEVLLESKSSHACACSDALFGAAKMSMPHPHRRVKRHSMRIRPIRPKVPLCANYGQAPGICAGARESLLQRGASAWQNPSTWALTVWRSQSLVTAWKD